MTEQQETLENCIQLIQHPTNQISTRKKIKIILKIVKHFAQYAKDTDTLPPQTLIPCCLFVLPVKFCQLLKISESEPLEDIPQHKAIQLALQTYLKAMVRLLEKSDQQIKHVIIQGVGKAILLTVPYPKIAKKWLKQLISIWSAEAANINLGLRAFIAINKYLKHINEETFMWTLRRIYVAYFENSKQVSWRNLQHVNFMINSFCELAKINDSRTYYVLFGYIRSIALQMANLNKTKRKQKVELINKLYSNQILNCFKLFTAIIARVNSQQLTSLIYPLVELTVAYEKISQATQFLPLKLHILTNLLTIMQSTGVFVPPVLEIINNLLHCKLFSKKLSKRAEKMNSDLELSYRLSPGDLVNTNLINEIFESIFHKCYWLVSIVEKMAGGAEIVKKLANIFKKAEFPFSGYKTQVSQIGKVLREDFWNHYKIRASKKVSIQDKKAVELLEKVLLDQQFQAIQKYTQVKDERQEMLKKKLLAENEQDGKGQGKEEIAEDDDQLNSGWQEAESGASSFHDQDAENGNKDLQDSDEMEDESEKVSYQGDLDEEQAEQAIQKWQEEEWDSQEQF